MAPKKKPKKKLSAYNRHVQKHMKAGRTMKQAAASWKSGSRSKYSRRSQAKRVLRGKRPARLRGNPHNKGGKSTMGKSGFNTQKIFKYLRIGALALPAAQTIMSTAPLPQKINQLKSDYFGVDAQGNFSLQRLGKGWIPFLAATAVTYGVPKIASIIRRL